MGRGGPSGQEVTYLGCARVRGRFVYVSSAPWWEGPVALCCGCCPLVPLGVSSRAFLTSPDEERDSVPGMGWE